MLSYYTAKGTFTKLQQETQEEIQVAEEQIKAKKVNESDEAPVAQQGQADGKWFQQNFVQFEKFSFSFWFLCKSEKLFEFSFLFQLSSSFIVVGFIRIYLWVVKKKKNICFMLALSSELFKKPFFHFRLIQKKASEFMRIHSIWNYF